MKQEFSVVGKRVPRKDAVEKSTGAACYTVDLKLPGMLVGKILRSPHAHARIIRIDKSKAEKLPGVAAVITHQDIPQKKYNGALSDMKSPPPSAAKVVKDQYVLTDKARYVGDAVAAVAAVNQEIAEKALGLIEVEYEVLPAVFDALEAMQPGAPRIHDFAERNIGQHINYAFGQGDVEKGFQQADYIVEITISTSKQKHCQLEADAAIAVFDGSGRLTLWSQIQAPHPAKQSIASIYNLPEGMVRIITPAVGGGFGGRSNFNNELICIALAQKSGKPVKIEYTREEDFNVHHSRQPFIQTGKLGITRDGKITAIQMKIIANGGAYFEASAGTMGMNMNCSMSLYRCPNFEATGDIVYTNLPISGGMRGFGNPQGMFVLEQLIDMACEKIGMDQVKFRLGNCRQAGDPSWITTYPIASCALNACIRQGAAKIGWNQAETPSQKGAVRKGKGMAIMVHPSEVFPSYSGHSSALVKLNEDGSATLTVSAAEIGQGILSALSQIAAEELGLRIEDIHVVNGDTDTTLFNIGTYCSRETYSNGNAVLRAALDARKQLLQRAARKLQVSPDELTIREGRILVSGSPETSVSVAEVAKDAIYNFNRDSLHITGKSSFDPGPDSVSPSYQACFVELEVDSETGEVKLLKVVAAHDIGKAINPLGVEAQLEGGIVQGIGFTLFEEYVYNAKTGVIETTNFTTYKIPSATDLPEIEIILVEEPDPTGPFGAKGCGESGQVAVGPAIANALYNAVGVRLTDMPLTPEKILKALQRKNINKSK
jgi:xanthine dehydrogenase molybdenum-binding subunit